MLRNIEFSNRNLVDELKDKITLMNQIIENKDREIRQLIDMNSKKEKKASKKEQIDDSKFLFTMLKYLTNFYNRK